MTQQPFIFPRLICFAFALLTVLGSPAVAGELHGLSAPDRIEGKFIVVLNEDAPSAFGRIRDIGQEEVRELSKTMADEFELRTEWVYGVAAKGFSASMSEEKARRLSKDPRVKYVEVDKLARGSGAQSNPGFALDRIDQQTGTNNSYIYDNDGRGVTAYVIDSGVRVSHSEFAPGTGQHTQRVWPAFTAIDDAYGLNDCAGHGTAVASVIGGVTSGVAKAIPMRSYRVWGCDNQGPVSGIIAAVNEVALHYVDETVPRAGIVNMSLGVASGSMALDEAVQDAIDDELTNGQYPLTFVTSLGNDNSGACSSSPGGTVYDAIGVGATDQADARANFSNFGLCLDVFAPGVNVRAASHLSDTGFSYWSGTSFSAPLVAGAAALYLHVHGHLTSPAQVEQFIENNATTNVVTNPGNWLTPNRFLYSRLN